MPNRLIRNMIDALHVHCTHLNVYGFDSITGAIEGGRAGGAVLYAPVLARLRYVGALKRSAPSRSGGSAAHYACARAPTRCPTTCSASTSRGAGCGL